MLAVAVVGLILPLVVHQELAVLEVVVEVVLSALLQDKLVLPIQVVAVVELLTTVLATHLVVLVVLVL
jgi:hypothetical protein